MNINQLKQDLKDLEEGLNDLPEEFKDDVRQEIKDLKEQIKDAEKEVAAKDKLKSAVEKKIEKIEDKIKSPKTPVKVKATLKKSLQSVKKEVKEAVKEDVKERKAKPIKRKKASPTGAKRGRPKKVVKAKPVVKRKSKASMKYERALTNLQKLVNKDKELREKYKGKGVDLDRDATRKAKPFGYRLRGDNYRRPTKAEIKSGEAYYEARPERADVRRSKYPKLEDGGMMAKYGTLTGIDGKEELIFEPIKGYKIQESEENGGGTFVIEILKYPNYGGKGVRYYYDVSNRRGREYSNNLESLMESMKEDLERNKGKKITEIDYKADGGMMAKGGRTKKRTKAQLLADKRLKAKKPGKRVSESGEVYYESRENRSDKNRTLRLAKGGKISNKMMELLDVGFTFNIDTDYPDYFLEMAKEKGNLVYIVKKGNALNNRKVKTFSSEQDALDYLSDRFGVKVKSVYAKGGRTPKRTKAQLIADKRLKALKPGKRVAESGEVYYESRPNRSDLNRRDRI